MLATGLALAVQLAAWPYIQPLPFLVFFGAVRDEGIGIEPSNAQRIFGMFERAVSDRHYGGLGLGLYISRQIVEALGGTIYVDSQPGQGATFTVELLQAPPGAQRLAPSSLPAPRPGAPGAR